MLGKRCSIGRWIDSCGVERGRPCLSNRVKRVFVDEEIASSEWVRRFAPTGSKKILLNQRYKFINTSDTTGVQFVADDKLRDAAGIGDLAVAAVDRDAGLDHLINPGISEVLVQFVRPDQ